MVAHLTFCIAYMSYLNLTVYLHVSVVIRYIMVTGNHMAWNEIPDRRIQVYIRLSSTIFCNAVYVILLASGISFGYLSTFQQDANIRKV